MRAKTCAWRSRSNVAASAPTLNRNLAGGRQEIPAIVVGHIVRAPT